MCETISCDRIESRIREDDLILASRRRISVVECLQICLQILTDLRDSFQEFHRCLLRKLLDLILLILTVCLRIFQYNHDLLIQMKDNIFDQSGYCVLQIINLIAFITEKARIHNRHQIVQNIHDLRLIRLVVDIPLVDRALLLIILQYII